MTQRYSDRGANILFQDSEGPFVHYSDYEKLVNALRYIIHYSCDSEARDVADKVLSLVGEDV